MSDTVRISLVETTLQLGVRSASLSIERGQDGARASHVAPHDDRFPERQRGEAAGRALQKIVHSRPHASGHEQDDGADWNRSRGRNLALVPTYDGQGRPRGRDPLPTPPQTLVRRSLPDNREQESYYVSPDEEPVPSQGYALKRWQSVLSPSPRRGRMVDFRI